MARGAQRSAAIRPLRSNQPQPAPTPWPTSAQAAFFRRAMTKIFVFVALLLTRVGLGPLPAAHAQVQVTVTPSRVCLMKPGAGGAKMMLGESQTKAEQALGAPSRKGTFFMEIDNATATVYYYGTSQLYFLKGRLVSFELTDGSLLVGQDPRHAFGCGVPAQQFVAYYGLRLDGKSGKLNELVYHSSALARLGAGADDYLSILFDESGKVVRVATERPC